MTDQNQNLPEKKTATKKAGGGLLIIASIILIIVAVVASQPTEEEKMCTTAHEETKKLLLDPDSGVFKSCEEEKITKGKVEESTGYRHYALYSEVRGKNAFGMMIMNKFKCDFIIFPDTNLPNDGIYAECKFYR